MGSIDDIHRTLAPFHNLLYQCIAEAWRRWKADFAPLLQLPYARCRANVMYDLMVEEARLRFAGSPDVRIVEDTQRCFLGIGDLLLRFKKIDDQLQTRNYPTQAALDFDDQLQLPGIPRGTRVTIGYRVDELQQRLAAVMVILGLGKNILGCYELLPADDEAQAPAPAAPVIPFPGLQPGARRITHKRVDESTSQGEGEADDHAKIE